jgi:hypothetical protein
VAQKTQPRRCSDVGHQQTRGLLSPQVHGVLDYPLAAVLIAGPLVLVFYLVVGGSGLLATLATRFESRTPLDRSVVLREAA